MNDTATSTGLTQATEPCWTHDRPGVWDEQHFQTREKAEERLADAEGKGTVARNEYLCWSAVAVCGYVYDEMGEGVEHIPGTLEEAEAFLRSVDWKTGEDGRWRCPTDTSCECWPEG